METYTGAWGDRSGLWTAELREQAGPVNWGNDGEYFMSIDDLAFNFAEITVAHDVHDW